MTKLAVTLARRIEAAFDRAIEMRRAMMMDLAMVRAKEEAAKLEGADSWMSAKNSVQRAVLMAKWRSRDEMWQGYQENYETHRDHYRLVLLEIERLKLLASLERGER